VSSCFLKNEKKQNKFMAPCLYEYTEKSERMNNKLLKLEGQGEAASTETNLCCICKLKAKTESD
jgi:hypothetical protein